MFTDEQVKQVRTFVAKRRPNFVQQEFVESRRLEGEMTYDDRDSRGFASILVYIQQGLADRIDDILRILHAVHAGQSGCHVLYPVCLLSFGDDNLNHIGRRHEGGVRSDVSAWAMELCALSGNVAAPIPTIIQELLPASNPIPRKRRIERHDLAVYICSTRDVLMSPEARQAYIDTVSRNSVWAFLSNDTFEVELGTFVPQESKLMKSTHVTSSPIEAVEQSFVSQSNAVAIQWYGERGILNSVVTHILAQQEPIIQVHHLLNAIEWPDRDKPDWIESITEATFVVELSAGDFGDPDLMIVCRTKDDLSPYCVFIEAKVVPYTWSMKTTAHAMQLGFNSSINGQLTLKYRFARALQEANNPDTADDVAEPPSLFEAYQNSSLIDPAPRSRHLVKPRVLQTLERLGLLKTPDQPGVYEERCYYVALTWDSSDHIWFNDDTVASDFLPMFLDENGDNLWSRMRRRCGWLGYQNMEKAIGLRGSHDYVQALDSMVSDAVPPRTTYNRHDPIPDPQMKALRSTVADHLARACGGTVVAEGSTGRGSSIKTDKVVAKVIRRDRGIFVGIREDSDHSPRFGLSEEEHLSVHGVKFRGCIVPGATEDVLLTPEFAEASAELQRCWGTVVSGCGPLEPGAL